MQNRNSAPHILDEDTTFSIMTDIIIALCPSLLWGFYIFGKRAMVLTLISVVSAVVFEILAETALKKKYTVLDLSSVLMGLLFAMTLPVSAPLWIAVLGNFASIVIFKQLLEIFSLNKINAVLCSRVILSGIFPKAFSAFTLPFADLSPLAISTDESALNVLRADSPLVLSNQGKIIDDLKMIDLIGGKYGGAFGTMSSLLLLCGMAYLILKKVISWEIPLSITVTVAAWSLIFPRFESRWFFMAYQLLAGSLIFCAIFTATDYASSPISKRGRLIYGVFAGAMTMVFNLYLGFTDGAYAGILAASLLSWPLNRLFMPVPYGGKRIPMFDFHFEKKEKDED